MVLYQNTMNATKLSFIAIFFVKTRLILCLGFVTARSDDSSFAFV